MENRIAQILEVAQTIPDLNVFELEAWLNQNAKVQRIRRVQDAIAKYSMYYDEIVNTGLRTKRLTGSGFNLAMSLINTIKITPLPQFDITLFRGIRETDNLKLSTLKAGDQFSDLGFSSKTLNLGTAVRFLKSDACCCLQVYYQPSHPLICLLQSYYDESEFLSYPGEILEVVGVVDFAYEYEEFDTGNVIKKDIVLIQCIYKGNLYPNFEFELRRILDENVDKQFKELEKQIFTILDGKKHIITIELENKLISVPGSDIVHVNSINDEDLVSDAGMYFEHGRLYRDFVLRRIKNIYSTFVGDLLNWNLEEVELEVEESPGIMVLKSNIGAYDILNSLIRGTFRDLKGIDGSYFVSPRQTIYSRD